MQESYHTEQPSLFSSYRVCFVCRVEKPLDQFPPRGNGRYERRCKECRRPVYREYMRVKRASQNPKTSTAVREGYKQCTKCLVEKPLDDFSLKKSGKNGRNSRCKECFRKWTNSDEEKARQREIRKQKRRDPEYSRVRQELINTWRKQHPESQQELTMRRNARKKQATTERVSYKNILERDGYWCYICSQPIDKNAEKRSPESLTFDHVVPLQPRHGEPQGTHSISNLKPSHRVCNARKGNKPLDALTPYDRLGP